MAEKRILFGRKSYLENLEAQIRQRRTRAILLRGPSGIGKSGVLREVHEDLSSSGLEISLLHSVESSAHTVDHIIDDLASQILSNKLLPGVDHRALARSIVKVARDKTWSIASASLLEVADHALPGTKAIAKTIADNISDELGQTAPGAMLERLRSNTSPDLVVGLLNIIRALADINIPGTIAIDQAEASSDAACETILGLATQLPESWEMLIAVNDELPEGIDFISRVWPRLAYVGGTQITLGPLTAGDLEAWCLYERGSAPERMELESVINNCQGRPLLLREWVSGASGEAEITGIWSRLGPYYQKRLSSLNGEARTLVRTLALMPNSSEFTLPFIANVANIETSTLAYGIVEELVNSQFLEICSDGESYRFVHDVTKRQVNLTTPRAVARESAAKLVAALRSIEASAVDVQKKFTMAMLEYRAESTPHSCKKLSRWHPICVSRILRLGN